MTELYGYNHYTDDSQSTSLLETSYVMCNKLLISTFFSSFPSHIPLLSSIFLSISFFFRYIFYFHFCFFSSSSFLTFPFFLSLHLTFLSLSLYFIFPSPSFLSFLFLSPPPPQTEASFTCRHQGKKYAFFWSRSLKESTH